MNVQAGVTWALVRCHRYSVVFCGMELFAKLCDLRMSTVTTS